MQYSKTARVAWASVFARNSERLVLGSFCSASMAPYLLRLLLLFSLLSSLALIMTIIILIVIVFACLVIIILLLLLNLVVVLAVLVVRPLLVVVVAATDHRRQCSCANQARGANSRGSQQAPFLKRKGCPPD